MSVSFTIQSNVKAVTVETEERLNRALNAIGNDWRTAAVDAITTMVYSRLQQPGMYKLTGRLRSSIAYSTPTQRALHTYRDTDGNTYSYTPDAAKRGEVLVGTNVEYAPAVHDGLAGGMVTVKEHQRRIRSAFGKPITPRTITVRAHRKNMPARVAKPFIEQPGIRMAKLAPDIIAKELNR